ncbi:hypothetical protein V5O48_009665 [Marasmius crinis-equi]|uniref:Uncharacterized protein n=1 Tax=Marasmius crinis-equi TaxID=585013 RepID=A0ABR3FAP1_9AGAR
MSDGLSLLTTVVSLGLKLQQTIEKIRGNKEAHRVLVRRINTSLKLLNSEYAKVSRKTHPSLVKSVQKLKLDLEYGLECCSRPAARATLSSMKSWFNSDSIEAALKAIEKQISACFQAFTALSAIRIERKLGDHNVEVNRKLDELLKRTPAKGRVASSSVATPSTSPSATQRVLHKTHKRAPSVARSEKSDISVQSSVSIPKSHSSDRLCTSPPISTVRVMLPPRQLSVSSTSTTSTVSTQSTSSQPSVLSLQTQADHLDSEYRRLRSLNFPSAAVTAARKAAAVRRIVCSMERSSVNVGDLARSLTYVGRSLRDLYTPDLRLGRDERHQEEMFTIMTECVRLYKEAFRADISFRLDLAMALYNLSIRHVEIWTKKTAAQSAGNIIHRRGAVAIVDVKAKNGNASIAAALDAANEAVHHFEILENGEPELYGTELANALLNLSYILTDLGRNERALGTARRAVSLCYQYVESLDGSATGNVSNPDEERNKRLHILHKALMRVSWCLEYLGRKEESAEAGFEAHEVLKNQGTLLTTS